MACDIRTYEKVLNKIEQVKQTIDELLATARDLGLSPEELDTKSVIESLKLDLQEFGKDKMLQQGEEMSTEQKVSITQALQELDPNISIADVHSWLYPNREFKDPGDHLNGSLEETLNDYTGNTKQTSDFIERVYYNTAATNYMIRQFQSGVIQGIMVDLKNEKEILGNNDTLNTELWKVQENFYQEILKYIDVVDPNNKLPRSLRINSQVAMEQLRQYFRTNTNSELNKFFNFQHDAESLSIWRNRAVVGEVEFERKLRAYNAYFILSKFDSMLFNRFKSLIQCRSNQIDSITTDPEKYEYNFDDDFNNIETWQQEDLQQKGAYDLMRKSLQTFIESCPIRNFTSKAEGVETGTYLTKDHITFFVQQIKKEFRKKDFNRDAFVTVELDPSNKNVSLRMLQDSMQFNESMVDIDKLNTLLREGKRDGEDRSTLKQELAILFKESGHKIGDTWALYMEDIIDNLRYSNNKSLKTIFDARYILKQGFKSSIEKRVFDNLRHYFFKDFNSLYSTSTRMYGELASLFDTTSIIDFSQQRINEDGSISKSVLSPKSLDRALNKYKEEINSGFVAGECQQKLQKYNADIVHTDTVVTNNGTVEGNSTRQVTFQVKNLLGETWNFSYNTLIPAWTLVKKDAEGKFVSEFSPGSQSTATSEVILNEFDFNALCPFVKDVLNVDFFNNRELRIAFLDHFKNLDGSYDYHSATMHLIDTAVPIFANAKIFREAKENVEVLKKVDQIFPDTLYTVKITNNNLYRLHNFYITADDLPYTIKDESGAIKPDRAKMEQKLGNKAAKHLTKKQLQEYIDAGYDIGTMGTFSYADAIEDWYGQGQKGLRTSVNYQGIDLISNQVSLKLEPIQEAVILLRGETFRSQVRTAENTNITIGQSSMLIAEKFARLQRYSSNLNPMSIMWQELKPALLGYEMSREGVNGTNVKQHKDFNFKENFYSSFVVDFLMPMYMNADWNPRFTESVTSDKPNVPKIVIEKLKILRSENAKVKIKEVLGDAYRKCFENMKDDYDTLREEFNKDAKNIAKYGEIPLSIDDNFTEFNQWCYSRNLKPFQVLSEMCFYYNQRHRNKPIALANNVHYHVNKDSGNIEMVFSFIEALGRYTLLSQGEFDKRITELRLREKDIEGEGLKNTQYYASLRQSLQNAYSKVIGEGNQQKKIFGVHAWNDRVIKLITSENTRDQLGENYNTFVDRFLDPTRTTLSSAGIFASDPFDTFINTSNVEFISKLLKNDVTLDLHSAEGAIEMKDCIKGIFSQIEEYSKRLGVEAKATAKQKQELQSEFRKLWFTSNQDRMVFGLVEVEENGEWKLAEVPVSTAKRKTDEIDTEEYEDDQEIINTPVKLSCRSDLEQLQALNEKGELVKFYDSDFSLSKLQLFYNGKKARIRVNPILEQYNLNSFLWSSLSNFSGKGTHIWGDAKKGTNTLDEECLKWFDDNKRNVVTSATKLQYKLGDVWGVGTKVNVAVIEDIIATCSGIFGDLPTVKPYDGAAFVNPFMKRLEDNSLNNQITGVTKKPIYCFYDERVMAGGLGKLASYAITNDTIRNSTWNQRMMWKMTNIEWYGPKGETADDLNIDLTLGLGTGCRGLQYTYDPVTDKEYRGPMYYETQPDGRRVLKEITEFTHIGTNRYRIVTKEVNQKNIKEYETNFAGQEISEQKDITIKDNYTFWKVLGGYNSVEYNTKTKRIEYSENSINTVADWQAKIRFRSNNGKLEQTLYMMGDDPFDSHGKFTIFEKDYNSRDSRMNWCPLKEANIHYLFTEGAVKKYAANINGKSEYFTDKALNFFKMEMSEAGIQLDPTHEADQSIVSMMTQVISALAERGYTSEQAQEVYEALSELTSLAIADDMQAFKKVFDSNDNQDLQVIVSRLIVDEFVNNSATNKGANLPRVIAERLIDEGKKGKVLKFKDTQGVFPFSDPAMFGNLQTVITSAMNKKAIKAKLFGVLAVLNPSHEIHKIYGKKRLSEIFTIDDLITEQANIQKNFDGSERLLSLSETEIGRTYQVVADDGVTVEGDGGNITELNGQIISLTDSDVYYLWKYRLSGKNYKLKEILYTYGKEYVGNSASIQRAILNDNGQFNFYEISYDGIDTPEVKRIADVSDLNDAPGRTITKVRKLNLFGRNLASYNIHITTPDSGVVNRYDLKVVQDSVINPIENKIKEFYKQSRNDRYQLLDPLIDPNWYKELFTTYNVRADKQDLWRIIAKNLKAESFELSKVEKERELQKNLSAIKDYGNIEVYDSNLISKTVKVGGYNVKAFEAILPKIYASLFGLRKGDSVGKVMQNKYFFFERILENYIGSNRPDASFYDLCFKRADGEHVYIKYAEDPESISLDNFDRLSIDRYTDETGTYRMDPYKKNSKMYPLADKSDQVYFDRTSRSEVIVTSNLDFYIKDLNYLTIELSKSSINNQEVVLRELQKNRKKSVCKNLLNRIKNKGSVEEYLKEQDEIAKLISQYNSSRGQDRKDAADNLKTNHSGFYDLINTLATKQKVAFEQSLNFTVARIPAQGMQSFMAMEIVGFNESGVNDCYVSAEQIRLQGSDYDVDKATFMGFAYDKAGRFVRWSPFMQDSSIAQLNESMDSIPYPTGRECETLIPGSENSIDYNKYKELFIRKKAKSEDNESMDDTQDKEDNESDDANITYRLKKNRNLKEQKLLGEMLREINKVSKQQRTNDRYAKTFYLEYNNTVEKELVQAIQWAANHHNLYITRVGREEKSNLLKNFVSYKTFAVAKNPANALVGETTVDESAKPLKDLGDESPVGAKPEDSRPGDSSIMFSALYQNHTGKDVIGIAASMGMKCMHAMTQAVNRAIADGKDLSNLTFDIQIRDPKDGAIRHYHFLADANLGLLTETDLVNRGVQSDRAAAIYDRYLNHTEWAGSNESGIMTLATDNAKELKLDRLNAGKDLAGLYFYGISIGMNIRDIFNIMTSQTAQVLSRVMKENIFTGDTLRNRLSEAIDFIKQDNPILTNVHITDDTLKKINDQFNVLGLGIQGLNFRPGELSSLYVIEGKSIKETIVELTQRGEIGKYLRRLNTLKYRIQANARFVKQLKTGENTSGYSYEQTAAKKSIDNFIDYVSSIYEIVDSHIRKFGYVKDSETGKEIIDPTTGLKKISGDIWADLYNIGILEEGEQELSVTRQLLGLNQGQKTKTSEAYKFYNDFSRIIKNRLNKRSFSEDVKEEVRNLLGLEEGDNSYKIDFNKFFKDNNYRQNVIKAYDRVKHSFNPLWVVTNVPHFNSYLEAANAIYMKTRASLKSRMMTDVVLPYISDTLGIRSVKETDRFYRRALSWIDGLMSNAFMRESIVIEIPAGNKIYKKVIADDGSESFETKVYNNPFYIQLGTQEGNETFRNWMNQEVIPRLKEGKLFGEGQTGRTIKVEGPDGSGVNTFLRDITSAYSNRTPTKNNIMVYALPIDTIPKSDTEIDELARYTMDFYNLKNYRYNSSDEFSYSITDLFFYYNLINFQNSSGGRSLTPLFENFVRTGEESAINRYMKFISNLDTEYEFKEGVDYTEEMLALALAPTSSEMSAIRANQKKLPFFYQLNRQTLKYDLYQWVEPDKKDPDAPEDYSGGYMARNNYSRFNTPVLDSYTTKEVLPTDQGRGDFKVDVGNGTMWGNVEFQNGIPKELTLRESHLRNQTYPGEIKLRGVELNKYIEVVKTETGNYKLRLNSLMLDVKVSSMIRDANCLK